MLEIGQMNSLEVAAVDEAGAWMAAGPSRLLLPRREIPAGTRPGERLEVFVYADASGAPLLTLQRPKALLGDFALLRVSQVTKVGAFLEWGLEKELLAPFSEQPERMKPGRRYLVKVCLDNTGRLVATARIDQCLETGPGALAEGEPVEMILWQFTDLGAKVIVNGLYGGLLYKDEVRGGLKRGDRLQGFVSRLREDGKIDVTLRKVGREGVEEAQGAILAALGQKGFLPLHDQSPPEAIRLTLGMSKKVFKKAVGGLYKAGRVELTEEGIRLKE